MLQVFHSMLDLEFFYRFYAHIKNKMENMMPNTNNAKKIMFDKETI